EAASCYGHHRLPYSLHFAALARVRADRVARVEPRHPSPGVEEHRDGAQQAPGPLAVEGAYHFGRHAWGDVHDKLRRRVADKVDAEARSVDLSVDLVGAVQALVDVPEHRCLVEPSEAVPYAHCEAGLRRRVADRHRARRQALQARLEIDL